MAVSQCDDQIIIANIIFEFFVYPQILTNVFYVITEQETKTITEDTPQQENSNVEVSPEPATTDAEHAEELDVEFLSALGDSAPDTPIYGEKIHETLAQRWLPILRRGIPKEAKETLLKEQTIPENCKLLRAPVLNPEISAALIESTRNRDKKIEAQQQQLGLGITAISRAMNILVTGGEDKQTKVQAVKIMSDACRILSDLHYVETKSRINLITPALDKSFTNLIQDMERDESLFGSKLADKIKASKTIEKQGLQIKKATGTQKAPVPSTSQTASTSRTRYQGNWTTPSRYQPSSNRGGRGGAQRTSLATQRASNTTTQAKNSYNKQRAAPRQ